MNAGDGLPASPWVRRWAPLLRPGSRVLDVACGGGRHARLFAAAGHAVTALDRDAAALATLATVPGITTCRADIEGGPWPCPGAVFDAVVVTNYLYRPLFPALLSAVAPGGLLIYETFAVGNERYGRPSNPDFLLRPGELIERLHPSLEIVAYEAGLVAEPKSAVLQRVCARRASAEVSAQIPLLSVNS
jgi:SAM-dependent methyltransferase